MRNSLSCECNIHHKKQRTKELGCRGAHTPRKWGSRAEKHLIMALYLPRDSEMDSARTVSHASFLRVKKAFCRQAGANAISRN